MSIFYQGKLLRFKFNSKKALHATNCKLTISSKLEEIATKDTDGTVVIPSNYSISGSTEVLMAKLPEGDTTHITTDDLLDMQLAGTEIPMEFTTGETGDFIYTFNAYIDNFDIGAQTGESVKVSISFKGNGNLTKETVSA
ncbi:phage tail tube protein [Flavobacterium aquiphilum]|uniref:phage tail tube protein n=1 Tax=Flavobacterium aquiphilum TaxID=3003261 RepID=UPI00248125A9|nr:phage tail tube protein [Flavobacterium aquiphilum]